MLIELLSRIGGVGADSLSPNLVGFVLAADALIICARCSLDITKRKRKRKRKHAPLVPGLPKEVRSDLLADLSGARIFIYLGHCDRVQPVNLPLKFIFG